MAHDPGRREGDDGIQRSRFLEQVAALNRQALERLRCEKAMSVVPGAGHLFEEPGTLDAVVALATAWFERHLPAAAATPGPV